ncbi:hypothetical protein [Novosphingobium sp. ST904]|uniref:hypothetical protein n=1 Tax=Novosphingobium sp. ST904 TaxID=1684385 RepID=UPI0006C87188|nr:hypothetical protein [Novosphingobium sp. ST904]KPH66888.1 hypothetical protein ADT71_03800 [Novosphingobium sp. ST904]TCM39132.1 hypothetical protein EDF59_10611 [Novosphingobium sp. ST904]
MRQSQEVAPVARLSDDELATAVVVAAAPLPALDMADNVFLAQILRMMDVLPRRPDDSVGGKLRHRAYELVIGGYPRQALEFLATETLRSCKFYPSTTECVEILCRWRRNDDAVRAKLAASTASRREQQARFDDAMVRLSAGTATQAEIDAMPDQWKSVGETRSYLWRHEDGTYTARVRGGVTA